MIMVASLSYFYNFWSTIDVCYCKAGCFQQILMVSLHRHAFCWTVEEKAGLSYLFSVCYQQSMICVATSCICLNMLIVLVAPSRLILEKWMNNMGLTCIMLTYVNASCKKCELPCNVGSFAQANHVLPCDMTPSFEKAANIVGPSCLCPYA